ncbi:MAG: hypothetical protein ACI8P0_003227 [Planctomycetaceae bacterium]|jgi:hypothetical protein
MNPLELQGTEGATPAITLAVTNMTGRTATLHGWIDFNQDGKPDSATEEAQATISSGKTAGRVTLTFPTIPSGSVGQTSARFQLSMDSTAADTAGTASEGEVEDYVFTITAPGSGTVDHFLKIADGDGVLTTDTLLDSDKFGSSVANIGDLNGDGIDDLAVGAIGNGGAVHVLFMNPDGTVDSTKKIGDNLAGGPSLDDADSFGSAVAAVGDLDGDGVTELAVGARGENIDGSGKGAVYILFLNPDGTARSFTLIASKTGGGPRLKSFDKFGTSMTSVGDLDGDGIVDLAVGAVGDNDGGHDRGAVYVLLLNADGTVRRHQKIADGVGGLAADTLENRDFFGRSVTMVGDLNGDGVPDLAIGANDDENVDAGEGAVYVLLMNSDGTVLQQQKISDGNPGGLADGTLDAGDDFGESLTGVGDLNGDGVPDLIVGASNDEHDSLGEGAVYVLLLNAAGTVKQQHKISDGNPGGLPNGTLGESDHFGRSVSAIGDLNGDGITDLAVGASDDNTGGTHRGALYVVFLSPPQDFGDAPDTGMGTATGDYNTTLADDGPSHVIVAGLHLGASADGLGEGAFQNNRANEDDANGTIPDDEDGVLDPLALQGTEGTAPTVTLLATNTTGGDATLYGWIDFNQSGFFANSGVERTSVVVPAGTVDGRFTLTFRNIKTGEAGTTYARFRLSTDTAAAKSTGAADDGEVEDYVFTITAPSDGTVDPQ